MKPRTYLILFLTFFGEALIVTAFLHFSMFSPGRITALNIVVTSIVFLLFMTRFLQPRHNFNDRSQKVFAGMGIRGYALIAYSIAATWLMIQMNGLPQLSFTTQLIVHAGLLFLFGLGLFFSTMATDKVEDVYLEHTSQRAALDQARRVAAVISEKALRTDLDPAAKDRIRQIGADLRYVSPANTPEAASLEDRLLSELQRLDSILSLPAPDHGQLAETLLNFESLYRQRKQVYAL